jgi:ribonuclease R
MNREKIIIESTIHNYDIPMDWPDGIKEELERIGSSPASERRNRLDLRHLPFVTIDGADARDFDDAVYGEPDEDGWKLWVAIADVSYFVPAESQLDRTAKLRGNSVYLQNRVVPMLPERLSNDICSLIPHQDRYVMVCEIKIGKSGQIRKSFFREAVIVSQARLTYDVVQSYLDGRKINGFPYDVKKSLDALYGLVHALTIKRKDRGSLDLEIPQARIEFSKMGAIENISRVYRNDAHRLIEECMLAANLCAARLLGAKRLPALFRIHEEPAPEEILSLRQSLAELGLTLPKRLSLNPRDLTEVICTARNKAVPVDIVQMLLLRSMKQAVYSETKGPHFALGYPVYTHFTSPIRRYPDLVVHRLLKNHLGWDDGQVNDYQGATLDLAEIASHCSATERRAESAERAVARQFTAEFMKRKIGLKFDGVISGVTEFGVFVQLNDFPIDGLIHVSKLGLEYFLFDAFRSQLTGQTSGLVWRLGDPVRVVVARVDLEKGRIDFSLVRHNDKPVHSKGQRNKSSRPQRARRNQRQAIG